MLYYGVGGKDEKACPQSSVEVFDFKTSKWRNLPSIKEAKRAFAAEIV